MASRHGVAGAVITPPEGPLTAAELERWRMRVRRGQCAACGVRAASDRDVLCDLERCARRWDTLYVWQAAELWDLRAAG